MSYNWKLEVDWNGDGIFEADEGPRLKALRVERGRRNWVKRNGKGFERPKVGRIIGTLENYDGRFDPYNVSSPLYPNVVPGREYKLTVHDGTATRGVIRGRFDDFNPLSNRGVNSVKFTGVDGWQLLDQEIKVILQSGITTDVAIGAVLDASAWPAAWGRSLGVGSDEIPYFWADSSQADETILSLADSEFGQFAILGTGQAKFVGRHALYGASPLGSILQSQIERDIAVPQPWENVRNLVRVTAHPRVLLPSPTALWQLRDPLLVQYGQTIVIQAEFRYLNRVVPIYSLVTPISGTDYRANTASDDSGIAMTNYISLAVTTYGTIAYVSITNTHPNTAAYVTLLQLRGIAVDSPDVSPVTVDRSAGSIYGQRTLELDLPWQQSVLVASDFAHYLANLLDSPIPYLTIPARDQPTFQFLYDLNDRVTLTIGKYNINSDFYLDGVTHEWLEETGQDVRSEYWWRSVDQTEYWRFTTRIGQTSRFSY